MNLGLISGVWTERRLSEEALRFMLRVGEFEDFNPAGEDLYSNLGESCRVMDQTASSLTFYQQTACLLAQECGDMVAAYRSWYPRFASTLKQDGLNQQEQAQRGLQLMAGGEILRRDLKRIRTLIDTLSSHQDCRSLRNNRVFPLTFDHARDYLLVPRIFVQRTSSYASFMGIQLERCLKYDHMVLETAARKLDPVSDVFKTSPLVPSADSSSYPSIPGQSPQPGDQQPQMVSLGGENLAPTAPGGQKS